MSVYTQWTDYVVSYIKTKGEKAFWKEYGKAEEKIYRLILSRHEEKPSFILSQLAKEQELPLAFVVGFLDGINESLKTPLDVEGVKEDDQVTLDIDYHKLYINMLDAGAEYLYRLPQWDAIFSEEKRKELRIEYKESKMVHKVGRNEPCPCGSGKKYKKCCGANGAQAAS
ncbi:Protein export cytoplasm protein SecA ATPase RNA helicase [Clostridiaceae bacterium JG1575]|nr:Protein export cytoplasm protein SecA ATPase RNA helicase [Clostridiaceae bacterium JG1575]